MRALFGGVIGAVVSASAWLAMEHFNHANYGWMVCLVGLVTGVCVHQAAASGSGGLLRGILAVALTFAAIVGGPRIYLKILLAASPDDGPVTAQLLDDVSEASEKKKASDSQAIAMPEIDETLNRVGKGDYSKSALKKNITQWDTFWLSLAALAAYITGKGGDRLTAAKVSDQDLEGAAEEQQES